MDSVNAVSEFIVKDFNPNLDGEIHLFSSLLDQPGEIISHFWATLSKEEKDRISKYKFKLLRDRQTVSNGLLKSFIANYLNIETGKINFVQNEYGKPLLKPELNEIGLHFNISHSEHLGMFAFTIGKQLGIDIESVQEITNLNQIVDLCFSDFEKEWYYNSDPGLKKELFYKVWTGKEAYIKAIGKGLSFPLKEIEFKINSNNSIEFQNVHG
ncbi:MAG: 4'-phosphopantetheinyl transferase superfamily protein, partial [Bacteroidia bacterium]|nr:4'-phosphopantetheinyl transferase superfamily protein [Bacteroidia bacterium]